MNFVGSGNMMILLTLRSGSRPVYHNMLSVVIHFILVDFRIHSHIFTIPSLHNQALLLWTAEQCFEKRGAQRPGAAVEAAAGFAQFAVAAGAAGRARSSVGRTNGGDATFAQPLCGGGAYGWLG